MCVKFTPHLSWWKMLKSPSPPQWFSRWLTQWAEWSAEDQTSQNIHLHIWCLRAKHSSHGYRVWNRIFSLIHTAMETVSHTNWTPLKFDGVLNFQKGSWGDLMSINRFTTNLLMSPFWLVRRSGRFGDLSAVNKSRLGNTLQLYRKIVGIDLNHLGRVLFKWQPLRR